MLYMERIGYTIRRAIRDKYILLLLLLLYSTNQPSFSYFTH